VTCRAVLAAAGVLCAGVVGAVVPGPSQRAQAAPAADRPAAATCQALRAHRWLPAVGHPTEGGTLRVVALQVHLSVDDVVSYASWRTAVRCQVEDQVVPLLRPGLATLVVFDEDAGLVTTAVGSRGATVRAQAHTPLAAPAGDAAPVGVAAALGQLAAAYAPQVAAYSARFPGTDARKATLLAATDTYARAFSQTFSDVARDYGVYVVAANNQATYRASREPADIATFADPDLLAAGAVPEVYVATSGRVPNTTFLWGPADVHPDAPAGERNLLSRTEKVPLTSTETDLLALDEGPATGAAAVANARGIDVAGLRLGFATSLPAFQYGYPPGDRPAGLAPCADVRVTWMPCLDSLGVDTVIQADANPGRWAGPGGQGGWQPLEWTGSSIRAVRDPTVHFRYTVNPFLVGNLFDLPFDGQSNITARSGGSPGAYVGTTAQPGDAARFTTYAGPQPAFLALAPWVVPDGPRPDLAATSARLAPGSRDPLEDDYLETAVWADLVPADGEGGAAVLPEAPAAPLLPLAGLAGPAALLLAGSRRTRRTRRTATAIRESP